MQAPSLWRDSIPEPGTGFRIFRLCNLYQDQEASAFRHYRYGARPTGGQTTPACAAGRPGLAWATQTSVFKPHAGCQKDIPRPGSAAQGVHSIPIHGIPQAQPYRLTPLPIAVAEKRPGCPSVRHKRGAYWHPQLTMSGLDEASSLPVGWLGSMPPDAMQS